MSDTKSTRHTYTSQEILFITENYPKHGAKYCAERLNLNEVKIQKMANGRGFTICDEGIANIHKLDTRSRYTEKFQKEYNIFFDFNNLECIYLFGFLWADGNIDKKTGRIALGIQEKDGIELKSLIESKLFCTAKIIEKSRYEKRVSNIMNFRKCNYLIAEKLFELEFDKKSINGPNKFLKEIPENLHYMFWRGYFDGDGCAYTNKKQNANIISFSSSYTYDWTDLIKFCQNNNITYRTRKYKNKLGYKASGLYITKISNIINFFELLYPNKIYDNIGLKRKFDKMILIKYEENPKRNKPKFNYKTNSYCVYNSRNSFLGQVRFNNKIFVLYSPDIEKCRQFVDKINLELKRYEYLNDKSLNPNYNTI